MMVAACCMRSDSTQILSAATCNTGSPYRRYNTKVHHPVTLSWHQADQSWIYYFNAECLARKHSLTFFNSFGLAQPGLEPATSRFRDEHSYHSVAQAVYWQNIHFLANLEVLRCISSILSIALYVDVIGGGAVGFKSFIPASASW